jgi:hypothetical protein
MKQKVRNAVAQEEVDRSPSGGSAVSPSGRLGALSGAAFVVLGNIGSMLGQDPKLPDDPSGQEVLDSARRMAGSVPEQVGIGMELLAWTALLVFVAYAYTRGRRAGWPAVAGVAGGVTAIAIKLASAGSTFAVYLLKGTMSPATALALSTMSLVSFIVFTLPFGLFLVCAAAAAMITRDLGRVIGWAGIVIGAASILLVVFTGPRIDSGFSPTFLLAMVWVLVTSVVWGFSRSRVEAPHAAGAVHAWNQESRIEES